MVYGKHFEHPTGRTAFGTGKRRWPMGILVAAPDHAALPTLNKDWRRLTSEIQEPARRPFLPPPSSPSHAC